MMNFNKKKQDTSTAAESEAAAVKEPKNCNEILEGLGRVENTLKQIEINGRGSDAEVRYVPREDGSKVSLDKTAL